MRKHTTYGYRPCEAADRAANFRYVETYYLNGKRIGGGFRAWSLPQAFAFTDNRLLGLATPEPKNIRSDFAAFCRAFIGGPCNDEM